MTERQEDTRTRLLDATLRVLAEHGVAGATSREITAAAGLNLQAITYHFGSKDELVAQALVGAVRRWVAPAQEALTGVGEDPVGRLAAAILALQASLEQARAHFPAYVEALAVAQRNEAVRAELVGLLHELRDALAASVHGLRDSGAIADWVDPQAMAALLVAAGDGLVLHGMLEPDVFPVEAALGQVARLLLAARTVGPVAGSGDESVGEKRNPAPRPKVVLRRPAGGRRPASRDGGAAGADGATGGEGPQ